MTTTYDPHHPAYLDEDDLREELDRVYDLCHGCRLCFKYCSAFPTLFEFIDRHDSQDSALLTDAERWQVVDECFQCKLCYINCPYTPGQEHEWQLDFPRLMLRAEATRRASASGRSKVSLSFVTDQAVARTDLVGKVGTRLAPLANKLVTDKPGTAVRTAVSRTVGIAKDRVLPPFAKQRFSSWFAKRTPSLGRAQQAEVALFPTCLVEYQHPEVGRDLVKVYERNGVSCSLPEGQACCGAPFLHTGDVPNFVKQAEKNIPVLAQAVREGRTVVAAQPTCGYVIRQDYPDYVGGDEARLVADNTQDASEFLWNLRKGEGTDLDEEFPGSVPESITYHAPCHLRAQEIGIKGRDLLKLTGTKIKLSIQCSGIDGLWGYKERNYELSKAVSAKLAADIDKHGNETVVGDCQLANGAIFEDTGKRSVHPIQLLARAYGIPDEQ